MGSKWLEQLANSTAEPLAARHWALRTWVSRSGLPFNLTLDYLLYEFGCSTQLQEPPSRSTSDLDTAIIRSVDFLTGLHRSRCEAVAAYRIQRVTAKRNGQRQPRRGEGEPCYPAFPGFDRYFVVAAPVGNGVYVLCDWPSIAADVPLRSSACSLDRKIFERYRRVTADGTVTFSTGSVDSFFIRRYTHRYLPPKS